MNTWKKCNLCKKDISFQSIYYICNVSTCTRKRTGLIFCSVPCWDAHVPSVRHKESWAVEMKSPSEKNWQEVLVGKRDDETFGPSKRAPEKEEEKPFQNPFGSAGGQAKAILRRR